MFSKKHFMALALVGSFLLSCTPKVGEAPPDTTKQKFEGTQCLSDLKPVVMRFAKGEATSGEVSAGWDCASFSIKKFKKYVYGRAEDRYTAAELVTFLEENFLSSGGPKISDELRLGFMRLKQLFVGGSTEDLTRAELDKIISIFEDLRAITLRLNPYMRLLSQNWSINDSRDPQAEVQFFESASDEIQGVAEDFAEIIAKNNQAYRFDNFVLFVNEYSKFYGAEWDVANQVQRMMPIVKKVKRAIAGGDQNQVEPAAWKSFIMLGARGYVQYLRYYYFIKAAPETGAAIRLSYLARTAEDLLGAIQDLLIVKPMDGRCGTVVDSQGGRKNNSCISKEDLLGLLNAFSEVWPEFKVSQKLVDETMRLKKIYFGGSVENISSADFERGKNKIPALKAAVEKFMPYFPLYSLEWDRGTYTDEQSKLFFDEARVGLKASLTQIGSLLEESYDLDSLMSLLRELDRLYPTKDSKESLVYRFGRYLPLVEDGKNIVFSDEGSVVKKGQWPKFLEFSSGFYSSFLYYRYFVQTETSAGSPLFESFKSLSDQVLGVVSDILLIKRGNSISSSEVKRIARRMIEVGVLPKGVTAQSIDSVVDVLLNRVLWPAELRLKGLTPNAITKVSLDNLAREIQIWYDLEKYNYFISMTPVSRSDLQVILDKKIKNPGTSEDLRLGVSEEAMLVSGSVTQALDRNGHLVISNIFNAGYDFKSLSQVNFNRTFGRILIRAATESQDRLNRYQGVTLAEAQNIFKQIRPFLVELKLLHPKNETFIESRFRDANIFTAHANGDINVNFSEMGDIIGMIFSGIKLNTLFRGDIEKQCVPQGVEVNFDTMVSEACFAQVYLSHIEQYLTATPEFLKYYHKIPPRDFEVFFKNLMKAAGYVPNSANLVRLAEGDLTPHVIQYVEMLFSRFDANKDSLISTADAIAAFPSFQGILQELTKKQTLIDQEDLLALFTYILNYGQPPSSGLDYIFKWLPWKSDRENWAKKWVISADRSRVAAILGYISEQVNKNSGKNLISKDQEDRIREELDQYPDQVPPPSGY